MSVYYITGSSQVLTEANISGDTSNKVGEFPGDDAYDVVFRAGMLPANGVADGSTTIVSVTSVNGHVTFELNDVTGITSGVTAVVGGTETLSTTYTVVDVSGDFVETDMTYRASCHSGVDMTDEDFDFYVAGQDIDLSTNYSECPVNVVTSGCHTNVVESYDWADCWQCFYVNAGVFNPLCDVTTTTVTFADDQACSKQTFAYNQGCTVKTADVATGDHATIAEDND